MGVCTSSNKRKKKNIVKAKNNTNINKNDFKNNNNVSITSRISKVRTFEKIGEKINKDELKQYNQTDVNVESMNNLKKRISSNRFETEPNELESYEKKDLVKNPISFEKEKKSIKDDKNANNIKTEFSEKKSEKESININNINNGINNLKDNTISTIKIDDFNDKNQKENNKKRDSDKASKKDEINNINKKEENNFKNESINESNNKTVNKNEEKEKLSHKSQTENQNNDNNNKENNKINEFNNIINENKNESKIKNDFYEEDTFSNITFIKEINSSNINNENKLNYSNDNYNNNYHSLKGNLFNLNSELNTDFRNSKDLDNRDNSGLYYFSEFHFTPNKLYSSEKDFLNLLNSQTFNNKIALTNRLLSLQERQWYKESILLSESLKINRENTYLDTPSFNYYLNKIINLYNHFNWLVWAISYYYCNSLLFNKNHWFNAKNSNLPSYDNLDWIRGFEWKGLFIKVQTYHDSKNIIKEINALKSAFLDYIQIIDSFKYKTNMSSLNLLSNELIFPFISYIYFGGIIIYVSATIKKLCYEDNSIFDQSLYNYDIKRDNLNSNNSNTKSNTNSNRNNYDTKEKQFDELSEVPINYKSCRKEININENKNINDEKIENKNYLKFNEDQISLNENLINNDVNISSYSKIDLENSKILSKITENNLIKIFDDISENSNINSEKYKFIITNAYSLIPNLFQDSELENNSKNINYIKFKNNYQYPRIYELSEKDIKNNELNTLNNLLDETVDESNIDIYQNSFNGIIYRIIYQTNNGIKNEKVTNFFVKFPLIQNRELSTIIINQYLKKRNINFLMHNFQINHKKEITDNNIIIYRNNVKPKMKYSLISIENDSLNFEAFHLFIDNICKNITSYKVEIRNVDNLIHFCEKFGLNKVFLPFIISKIKIKYIADLIKIYLFSNILKQYFCYNQGQNLLLKLSIYEASKDKDILNSTDTNSRDNNIIELQRSLLVNIIKFFLLPSQFIDSVTSLDYGKKYFLDTFLESLSFFVFMHALKIKKYEKTLNFSETFLSKMNIKEIIKEYSLICRNNPFLFIDTLEKLINFRMNPYLKYKASLDVENLKQLKKEEIVIFAPQINSFIDLPSIAGFIFAKSFFSNNMINISYSNNLLLSSSNFNITTKIGKIDSYMINNYNSKYNINNNNITKRFQDENDEENITISNNGMDDLSSSLFGTINQNQDFQSKNKFFNNNEVKSNNNINKINADINNENKEKKIKFSFKAILTKLILDNFLPPKINKTFLKGSNNSQNILSKYLTNNYFISNEDILIDYNNNINKIIGEIISFNGLAEMIIFKSEIFSVIKLIFIKKNLKQAKELINKMKEKFEKQYLFTFNQCSILSFLESLTYEKYKDSQDFYCKSLIFALFNLGDVRCNNCNGHPFILLPIYILCKITGYLENSDTNEYFKEMFRCLNFKINKNLKLKEIDENNKQLLYYCFPSVSDLKLKNNDFLYEKDFIIFLINSLLNFFYAGDNLLIDNDFLSYNKINYKISKIEEDKILETSLENKNNINNINNIGNTNNTNNINNSKIIASRFILEILFDKMSYLKYGPTNIILSFGNNNLNQTSHDGYDMLTLPRLVYKLCDLKIKRIYSGYDYNFVIDSTNNVFSWGDNSGGQCGLGDKIMIRSPKQVYFPELMDNDYIENIICGNNSTYFVSKNKRLFLCGFNIILKKFWYSPNLLELKFDSNIIEIKTGEDFTLFLTEKGNVYSMGFGNEGQLGIKNIFDEFSKKKYCSKPTNILNSIKSIFCGYKHSFAISYNRDIICWGKNNNGQLGLNHCEDMKDGEEYCTIFTPTKLRDYLDDIEIKDIICGKNFSFFQTKKNELLVCGNNDKGQLGIQENSNINKIPTKMCNDYIIPTEVEQFSFLKVIKISCGEEHSLAIIKDTTSDIINIWCWGSNKLGQLGLGSHIIQSKPKPIHYLLEFINHIPIDISTGKNHSIILLQRKDYNEFNNDETLTELIFKYCKI